MDLNELKEKLCKGREEEATSYFHKVEKVVTPFLRGLKKRKRVRADILPSEYKDLYLKLKPEELVSKLRNSLSDPIGITTLLNETAEILKVVTNSKNFNIYLTDYEHGEILLCPKFIKDKNFQARYEIVSGTYVAPHVAFTKDYVISSDILGDSRFPLGIPFVGTVVKAVICLPIISTTKDSCFAVLELYRDCFSPPYSLMDLQICSALTAWMGIAVKENNNKSKINSKMDVHTHLLQLANLYFSGTLPFNKLISDVLEVLKIVVICEQGAFYIFTKPVMPNSEDNLLAEAFEEGLTKDQQTVLFRKRDLVRFIKNKPSAAGHAARTGEVVNIHDAYKDSRFSSKKDSPFFRTRTVLCVPVKNDLGVCAVLKLINKLEVPRFRKEDIELVQSHLNFLCLICEFYQQNKLLKTYELKLAEKDLFLDFQTKSNQEDILNIKSFIQGETNLPQGFFKFDWDPSNFEEDCHKYIILAIVNSEILESCFEFQNLADFVLRVRRAYRPLSYHSFEHAFSVFHFAFLIMVKNKVYFTLTEVVTTVLVALCHDIDHSGLTNNFHTLKNDIYYQLYGDVSGESHRYEMTMFFIQATDLLSNVSAQNYQIISSNLKRLMQALDLSVHLYNRFKILELLNMDAFDWNNSEHRFLAQNMILTCSDYYGFFKPFELLKKITSNFYKEVHQQGDLEKAMEVKPVSMFDRNKVETIPENHILLINTVCIPLSEIIVSLFPNLGILSQLINTTLEKWKEIFEMEGQELWKIEQALVKERKDKRIHRVTLSSTLSSLKSVTSDWRTSK